MTSVAERTGSSEEAPSIDEVVQTVTGLRPLGAIAARILQITEGDTFSAQALAKVISSEPALSARMLQLANSAYYGFPRRIGTVRDAIVLLGFRAVRSATLAACVINAVPNGSSRDNARTFWRYSIFIGMVSEVIAQAERRDCEEAFTAGVLHNIGRLALSQQYPELMQRAQRHARAHEVSLLDAEREVVGYTDAELGGALAQHWNFPDGLVEAAARHRESIYAIDDRHSALALVVRARALAAGIGIWDGLETAVASGPPAEWRQPPLSQELARVGGPDGLLERVDAFLGSAIG